MTTKDLIDFGVSVSRKRKLGKDGKEYECLSEGWAKSFVTMFDLSFRQGTKFE